MRYVRIPLERVGVLIGPNGETKEFIEGRSGIRLEVNSEQGEAHIDDRDVKEPIMALKTEDVVRAIGRGFSPEHAFRLFADDAYLTIFDVHDYVGKKKKDVERILGRVVGREGKTRRVLEELTGAWISVYGHTVAVIADIDSTTVAKIALDMILNGAEHASVYRFLENKRREARMARMDF